MILGRQAVMLTTLSIMLTTPSLLGQTATLSGTVMSEAGKGVPGATVAIGILPQKNSPAPSPFFKVVSTDVSGAFTLAGVPNGTFQICPALPKSNLLSPCAYQPMPPLVTITSGVAGTMPSLVLKQGVHVAIRINDPTGKRNALEGQTDGAAVYVGASHFGVAALPAILTGKDAGGTDHDLLIPYDVPLTLNVSSKVFSLSDGKSQPLDKLVGGTYSLTVPSGKTPPTFSFTVTGVNP